MTKGTSDGTPGSTPCLEFRDVWFHIDSRPVIVDITLTVRCGDFVAILGPNGSGKTTLLKLALGLARPTRGTVRLFDEPSERFRAWDRVGYVPQMAEGLDSPFPATVEEVVAQGLYRGFDGLGIWRRSGQPKVVEAMATVGVGDLRGRKISSLSVGQQQRTLIARGLVRGPELLVLDEPAAGVDVAGQEQLYEMLRRLNGELGITILMVTHDIGAVLREAKTVACIDQTLVFHGPPHRMTRRELSASWRNSAAR